MNAPLLVVDDLAVHFPAPGAGPLGLGRRTLRALDGVSFGLHAGERLGIVGESGSGKSTLGRAMLGLEPVTAGRVAFEGAACIGPGRPDAATREAFARLRRGSAMVFQDPAGSLNPAMRAGDAIAEVLRVTRGLSRSDAAARMRELLVLVGLSDEHARCRPHELSGGQCQRVGIARALAADPKLVVADECVAALDVSIQGQIANLLLGLCDELDLALVFIAHDLAIVRRLCTRIAVVYLGRIVEEGPTEAVFDAPRHPYTRALIASIPDIDPDRALPGAPVRGEPPSPLAVPPGCAFHPRCAHARDTCHAGPPPAVRHEADRRWRCVLPAGTLDLPSDDTFRASSPAFTPPMQTP